jgi:hypothetical protein
MVADGTGSVVERPMIIWAAVYSKAPLAAAAHLEEIGGAFIDFVKWRCGPVHASI